MCLGGLHNRNKGLHGIAVIPVVHLSRICLATTRYTFEGGSGAGTMRCLGSLMGGHAAARTSLTAISGVALRHVLVRHHGRLVNRKRHCFSTLHGGRAVAHCADRTSGN